VDRAPGGDLVQLLVADPKLLGRLLLVAGLEGIVEGLDGLLDVRLAPAVGGAMLYVLTLAFSC